MEDGKVILSAIGQIVDREWRKTELIRREVRLDEYVIMPNHFHAILFMHKYVKPGSEGPDVGAHGHAPLHRQRQSLGSLIARFKGAVTRRAREVAGNPSIHIWQRNYFEHIIRGVAELDRLRRYIRNNPLKWKIDRYYPK